MYIGVEDSHNEYRPRLIIWQLTSADDLSGMQNAVLSQHECLLILDSIARFAKPIVVFTGPDITSRTDLHQIVNYGNTLGLKTIVEVKPDQLTANLAEQFHQFGSRVFRLSIDGCIDEDRQMRFKQTPSYFKLEGAVKLLREKKFEIHFSVKIDQPNLRKLGYYLDYAFRCNAQGLYCHLSFDKSIPEVAVGDGFSHSLDEFIGSISDMKYLVPSDMYFSPQCVKYIPYSIDDNDFDFSHSEHPRWIHCCLAGKSFAYIAEDGKVYMCSARCKECGDLRENNYDFKRLWSNASILNLLRAYPRTCVQTRLLFKEHKILFNDHDEMINNLVEIKQ